MKRFFIYILWLLLIFSAASCVREDLDMKVPGNGALGEGVDLTLAFNIEDLVSSMEVTPSTRVADDYYTPEDNVAFRSISSIAVFVIKADSEARGDMVAYRIIAPPDKIKPDIWYLGKDPEDSEKTRTWANDGIVGGTRTGYSRFNSFYTIDNQPFRTNDIPYNECDVADGMGFCDDQHYGCWEEDADMELKSDCVGYNGFAKVIRNELVTNSYGGTIYPAFDTDGRYDASFDINNDGDYDDFRDYKVGKRYHKSPAVILSFKYDNPMHGPVEKLTRGNYYILALANFRESLSDISLYNANTKQFSLSNENKSYPGDVTYNGDGTVLETSPTYKNQYIEDFIYSFIREWDPEKGIPGSKFFTFIDSAVSLSEITINSDGTLAQLTGEGTWKDATPLLRSKKARFISTGYQQVTLTPGNTNIYQMEISRTVSRSTFEVSNYSDFDLTVTDFRLSDNFAQGATFLFRPDDSDRFKEMWQGAPKVNDAAKAIVNFPDEGYIVPARKSNAAIFDAITYESGGAKDENGNLKPLSYEITVSYPGKTVHTFHPFSIALKPSMGYSALQERMRGLSEGESIEVFIESRRSGSYIVPGDDNEAWKNASGSEKLTSHINSMSAAKSFDEANVWVLIKAGDDSFYIMSKDNGKYLRITGSQGDSNYPDFTTDVRYASAFRFAQDRTPDDNYVVFEYDGYFLHVLNSGRICWNSWNDAGGCFKVYEYELVEEHTEETPATATKKIDIESFNMLTNVAEPLYYLRRNQHLNVHIGVTYNTVAQTIDFHVEPWKKKDNYVTFE